MAGADKPKPKPRPTKPIGPPSPRPYDEPH
jgi:hypothetical protein